MNNIVKYRGLAGMSQRMLADELGMSRTGLNLIESGQTKNVRTKNLIKMCEILNVTLVQLLGEENFRYLPETVEDIDYMISMLQKMKEGK